MYTSNTLRGLLKQKDKLQAEYELINTKLYRARSNSLISRYSVERNKVRQRIEAVEAQIRIHMSPVHKASQTKQTNGIELVEKEIAQLWSWLLHHNTTHPEWRERKASYESLKNAQKALVC